MVRKRKTPLEVMTPAAFERVLGAIGHNIMADKMTCDSPFKETKPKVQDGLAPVAQSVYSDSVGFRQ